MTIDAVVECAVGTIKNADTERVMMFDDTEKVNIRREKRKPVLILCRKASKPSSGTGAPTIRIITDMMRERNEVTTESKLSQNQTKRRASRGVESRAEGGLPRLGEAILNIKASTTPIVLKAVVS